MTPTQQIYTQMNCRADVMSKKNKNDDYISDIFHRKENNNISSLLRVRKPRRKIMGIQVDF